MYTYKLRDVSLTRPADQGTGLLSMWPKRLRSYYQSMGAPGPIYPTGCRFDLRSL
jgi:hypothetical protein